MCNRFELSWKVLKLQVLVNQGLKSVLRLILITYYMLDSMPKQANSKAYQRNGNNSFKIQIFQKKNGKKILKLLSQ